MAIKDEAKRIKEYLKKQRDTAVKVALFGQPGAGKSSLINAMIGYEVAEVGVETDKTVKAASYHHNGIELVDLPGYGTSRFPKTSYAQKFDIEGFDLFLCVSSGKLHAADTEFFHLLLEMGKVCLFVVNKHDQLWEGNKTVKQLENAKRIDIRKHVSPDIDVLFTSCREGTGLDALNQAIADNLDAAKKERWMRGAQAYTTEFLDGKKKACERYVTVAALASAANAINPIPGADVAVDLGILSKLFAEIRDDFGLDNDFLGQLTQTSVPAVNKLAEELMEYATKKGMMELLKRYAGKRAVQTLTRYIPTVGQVIAAGIGYQVTSNAGKAYLDHCYKLSKKTLNEDLGFE